jgi:hypothetical protein
MYRRLILLVGMLLALLTVGVVSAPQANANPPQQSGVFQTRYFNFYDAGGRECPDHSASWVTSDTEIYKYWPEGTSPVPGIINTTNYMVCWRGTVYFPHAGTWTVYTLNDDGMNVWVNGQIAMNAWYDQGPTYHTGDFNIPAPGYYSFEVKYYNAPNAGVACVSWAPKGKQYPWRCPYPPAPPPPPPPPCQPWPQCTQPPPCQPWPQCTQPPPCQPWPQCTQPPPQPCPGWPNCYNPPKPPPPPVHTCWYRVRYGDTLYSIAWKFGVTVWQLQEWNGIKNPNHIYAGTLIKVCKW